MEKYPYGISTEPSIRIGIFPSSTAKHLIIAFSASEGEKSIFIHINSAMKIYLMAGLLQHACMAYRGLFYMA